VYSTCLHCHASLGSNESIEAFPVGKRLAFDAAKGRLWVVCTSCGRWNLTPMEERWEAVEDCERQFREARKRVTKGEIGLAHLRSGAYLVRIGAPTMPEMAAWRYGRVFRKRWWTNAVPAASVGVGFGAIQLSSVYDQGNLGPGLLIGAAVFGIVMVTRQRAKSRLVLPDGRVATVRPSDYGSAILRSEHVGEWSLEYKHAAANAKLSGAAATHTLRGLLTTANYFGARPRQVEAAVDLLGGIAPADYINHLARAAQESGVNDLKHFPADIRHALEMALHDESERRAMEGELDDLRAEWMVAEEIAQIADDMFLPESLTARMQQLSAGRA